MKFIFTNQLFPKYYRQQKFETFLLIYFPMASEKKKNTDLASFFFYLPAQNVCACIYLCRTYSITKISNKIIAALE